MKPRANPPIAEEPEPQVAATPAEQPATDSNSNVATADPLTNPPMATKADAAQIDKPQPEPPAQKPRRPVAVKAAFEKPAARQRPAADLGTYARLTEAYYVARRCGGNLSGAYRAIVAEHGRVMQSHSPAEVAAVLRRAESRAGNSSCS